MNPVFIQVINAEDQMSCLVNVNSIDLVTRSADGNSRLFVSNQTKPLESLTDYNEVLSLIEQATSRPIAQ